MEVGIIDSGAQADNPALVNRISWFKDYVDPTNTTPQDPYGHGTAMAEIIGGTANADGAGGSYNYGGVAPQSSLYVARIGDASDNYDLNLVPQALSDLTAQGVKLINNSYGTTTPITSVGATDPHVASDYAIYSSTAGNGQLMVWAAGNNGNAQPSVEAGLPYYHSDLAQSWLAVVNVTLNSSGQVVGLDPTSNACGVAMGWCLAAPGSTYFTPVTGTVFSTGFAYGTSNAAAVVTGVAALVSQRFPYFTATNVQETLLGTATSLGISSQYGYGLVNAAAAVNGPGQLNWGVFDVNIPAGQSATFSNNMSGTGSLQLDGSGSLTMTGSDGFGSITVNGGTLKITGSDGFTGGIEVNGGTFITQNIVSMLSTSAISVAQGATLQASGFVMGNITSSGTVDTRAPSNASVLQINGNYTTSSTANTIFQMAGNGGSVQVQGRATLNNSSATVVVLPSMYPTSTASLLETEFGVFGQFGSLTVEGGVFTTGSLSYTPLDVDVTLTNQSVSDVAKALMPNVATTQQTAQHIQTALGQANTWAISDPAAHRTFLSAAGEFLHADSIAEAATSINSLSGQLLASSQGLTFEQAGIVNRTVADRLTDIVNGSSQQGAWFQGTGASGDIARSGYATGSYTGGGAVVGYDAALSDSFSLGAGLDWNRLGSTYTMQGGTSSSRSTGGMLYGKWTESNVYLSGRLGQDWISSSVSRWADLGITPAAIYSTRHDRMDSAYLEAGYNARSDAWTTTPFVSLGDGYLSRGTIAEQGAGGFGIAAGSENFNQSNAQIGARIAYHWIWNGGQMSIKGFALYQRVLAGSDLGFTAAYAGAPDATFQLEGVNSPRNSGWVGLGLNTVLDNRWSWFVNLDEQVASGGTKASVLSAGAQYSF